MKINVGGIDRVLRIALGVALAGLAAAGTIGPWGWLGIVLVLTGFVRFCPAYAVLGVNTCKTGSRQ